MKNSIIIFSLMLSNLVTNFIFAQGFHGQATYMSKRTLNEVSFSNSDGKNGLDDGTIKAMQEQMKKAFEKTYILDFNATESNYLKEQQLESPNPKEGGIIISFSGDNTVLYKNSKTKTFLQQEESHKGKTMLISDSLPKYEWKIEGEIKKIGGYDCYKATTMIKVTPKQKAAFEELKLKQSKQKKAPLFPAKEPKDNEVIAWFTNEIPVSHGPGKFWGLPGLILELVEGRTTYLCSKIVLNPKDKKPILVPKKGKVISQSDFDAAQKKAFDKMANDDGVIIQTTKD